MIIKPEELHKWYLEVITQLKPESYNKKAAVPYSQLTDEQKQINIYIAKKIARRIKSILKHIGIDKNTVLVKEKGKTAQQLLNELVLKGEE